MLRSKSPLQALLRCCGTALLVLGLTGCWPTDSEAISEQDAIALPVPTRVFNIGDGKYQVGEMMPGKWYPYTNLNDGKKGHFRIMPIYDDIYAVLSRKEDSTRYTLSFHRRQGNVFTDDLNFSEESWADEAKAQGVSFEAGVLKGSAEQQSAFLRSMGKSMAAQAAQRRPRFED